MACGQKSCATETFDALIATVHGATAVLDDGDTAIGEVKRHDGGVAAALMRPEWVSVEAATSRASMAASDGIASLVIASAP